MIEEALGAVVPRQDPQDRANRSQSIGVTGPWVSGDHCLSTSRNAMFEIHLDARPGPYRIGLGDSVACTPSCGQLEVEIKGSGSGDPPSN
jgi:hypothetical protein